MSGNSVLSGIDRCVGLEPKHQVNDALLAAVTYGNDTETIGLLAGHLAMYSGLLAASFLIVDDDSRAHGRTAIGDDGGRSSNG